MTALVFLRFIVHDHDNLFVAAEAVHAIGSSILIYKLMKENSCELYYLSSHVLKFHIPNPYIVFAFTDTFFRFVRFSRLVNLMFGWNMIFLAWYIILILSLFPTDCKGEVSAVNLVNTISSFRSQRVGMVQTMVIMHLFEENYMFIIVENKKHDKDILLTMVKRLKQDDNISKNIRKSGKEDLYADLLFFLRFQFLGIDCCYDSKLLGQHAIDVLEDLVIFLADGITTSYLELISVDSNITSEMNCMVVSMYEDRFDLYSFQVQLVKESDKKKLDKLHWWKKLVVNKAASTVSSLQHMVISPLSLSVKRTKELRALSGWRYYFSLFLEFSDITMPLVKVLFAKVSSAISFLLVCLIGRSLGLIYSGIRQSLGWR
ncbi:hypothetical protein ACHQM5_003698 [Ranunculus cassubicifolius]